MSRVSAGSGDLEFLQAFYKRGFVTIPRMMFDYRAGLGFDYDTIGLIFSVMACVGGPGESAFDQYIITRQALPEDFNKMHEYIRRLERDDIVRCEESSEERVTFSFVPLFVRMRALWQDDREHQEQKQASPGTHPVVLLVEKLLARPLSPKDVSLVLEWATTYTYGPDMIETLVLTGKNQGVTRMGYLDAIVRRWYEEGVRTPEAAEASNQQYQKTAGKYKTILNYLGFKRALTKDEQDMLDRWTREWGFSNDVIMRACAEATGKNNPLQYINATLRQWQAKGVRSVADVEQMDAAFRQRPAALENKETRMRKTPARSNVFLHRDKKDDTYYDNVFEKFDE